MDEVEVKDAGDYKETLLLEKKMEAGNSQVLEHQHTKEDL